MISEDATRNDDVLSQLTDLGRDGTNDRHFLAVEFPQVGKSAQRSIEGDVLRNSAKATVGCVMRRVRRKQQAARNQSRSALNKTEVSLTRTEFPAMRC